MLDSLVAVCSSSQGQPEPCEGNLVAALRHVESKTSMAPARNNFSDFRERHVEYDYLPTI